MIESLNHTVPEYVPDSVLPIAAASQNTPTMLQIASQQNSQQTNTTSAQAQTMIVDW
jgi:hypothetical protein